jgi:hypothetical protein
MIAPPDPHVAPKCLRRESGRTGNVRERRDRLSAYIESFEAVELVASQEAEGAVRVMHGKSALGRDGHGGGLLRRPAHSIYWLHRVNLSFAGLVWSGRRLSRAPAGARYAARKFPLISTLGGGASEAEFLS